MATDARARACPTSNYSNPPVQDMASVMTAWATTGFTSGHDRAAVAPPARGPCCARRQLCRIDIAPTSTRTHAPDMEFARLPPLVPPDPARAAARNHDRRQRARLPARQAGLWGSAGLAHIEPQRPGRYERCFCTPGSHPHRLARITVPAQASTRTTTVTAARAARKSPATPLGDWGVNGCGAPAVLTRWHCGRRSVQAWPGPACWRGTSFPELLRRNAEALRSFMR